MGKKARGKFFFMVNNIFMETHDLIALLEPGIPFMVRKWLKIHHKNCDDEHKSEGKKFL